MAAGLLEAIARFLAPRGDAERGWHEEAFVLARRELDVAQLQRTRLLCYVHCQRLQPPQPTPFGQH